MADLLENWRRVLYYGASHLKGCPVRVWQPENLLEFCRMSQHDNYNSAPLMCFSWSDAV